MVFSFLSVNSNNIFTINSMCYSSESLSVTLFFFSLFCKIVISDVDFARALFAFLLFLAIEHEFRTQGREIESARTPLLSSHFIFCILQNAESSACDLCWNGTQHDLFNSIKIVVNAIRTNAHQDRSKNIMKNNYIWFMEKGSFCVYIWRKDWVRKKNLLIFRFYFIRCMFFQQNGMRHKEMRGCFKIRSFLSEWNVQHIIAAFFFIRIVVHKWVGLKN